MVKFIEPAFQQAFGNWGRKVGSRPLWISLPVFIILLGIGFGVFVLEREKEVLNLWVSERGRISREKDFFEDSFDQVTPRTQALIIEPKQKGGNLLAPDALDEVVDLQDWVFAYEHAHFFKTQGAARNISLADICFKPVDLEPEEPCFQYTVLDCFKEGNAFTPGGQKNAKYSGIYSQRASYKSFDFEEDFTDAFVRERCIQWYNLGTADTIFLGGITPGANSADESTVGSVEGLRVVFGTKSKEALANVGVKKTIFESAGVSALSGLDLCQDSGNCDACVEEIGLSSAAQATCVPLPGPQSEQCCEFMSGLRDSPCVEAVWKAKPQVAILGNVVFTGCGIPTVELAARCENLEAIVENNVPAVCTCLEDNTTEECQNAAVDFVVNNPTYAEAFQDAQRGNDTAQLEVARVLTEEVECPTPEAQAVPEVCTCLEDSSSDACQTAGTAFVGENPEYADAFVRAQRGNRGGQREVVRILTEDVKCPTPAGGSRRLLQNRGGETPAVCTCLEDSSSEACQTAGIAFVGENPEYAETFLGAQGGDADAQAEVVRILTEDVGCPAPETQELPEVCTCLADSSSESCQTAALAFVGENPEYAEAFLGAQGGDADAQAEVVRILTEDVSCPAPESQELPEVCTCLEDSSSESCQTAALAFVGENPEYAEAFLGAQGGDADAQAEVVRILTEDVSCPAPESQEPPEVCTCLEDSSSEACQTAATAFVGENPEYAEAFVGAQGGDADAQAEVARILTEEICATEASAAVEKFRSTTEVIGLQDEDEAFDLLHGWEEAWREDIEDYVTKYKHIEVSWITASSLDDENQRAAKAQAPLIAVGYILVLVYMLIHFSLDRSDNGVSISKVPPGPFSAALGFAAIILAVFAAFGIIGLVSLTSLKTSPITLQIVPLLMVGLGINDFFVLASSLKSSLLSAQSLEVTAIMGATMASGGTSITLSSAANAAAFALGALSPIPAVQWFSIHMMIGVVIAYIVSMTIIPGILTWSVTRWKNGQADVLLPGCGSPEGGKEVAVAPKPTETKTEGKTGNTGESNSRAPGRFAWNVFSAVVLVVYCAWLAVSIVGISKLDLGLKTSDAVPEGEPLHRFLEPSEEFFQSYPIYVVFDDVQEFGNSETFQNARNAEFDFVSKGYKMDRGYRVTSWMDYYTEYVESKFCSNEICLDEVEWYRAGFSTEEFGDRTGNICREFDGDKKKCRKACAERCPQGPVGSPYRCQLSEDDTACYCPYRPKLKEEFFFDNPGGENNTVPSFWSDFLSTTSGGAISQSLLDFKEDSASGRNKFGIPKSSRTLTFVENLPGFDEKVRHLDSGRSILDESPMEAFPFDFIVYGVGEQYKDLAAKTAVAVAISVAVALLVMMPLIVHAFTAIIVMLCVVSSVVITAGTGHWAGMDLNYSFYVGMIVSVGLSVEFCAHIARDFMLNTGERHERAWHALKFMGFAVFNGGVTTFLGILPVAWAEFPYFQTYFFGLYSIVVAAGLFVGLGLLPVLLSMVGPSPYKAAESGKEQEIQMATV